MKERPILFSAPMVRAILDVRKCQTRRVVKMLPSAWCEKVKGNDWSPNEIGEWRYQEGMWYGLSGWNTMAEARCPYGQPGDRLWGRESWAETDMADGTPVIAYRAGGCVSIGKKDRDAPDYLIHDYAFDETPQVDRWRPSIHMPRWASRILLEVTAVRVERLQDISEADVVAEGVAFAPAGEYGAAAFRNLWESINGPGSWAANPWVWVVEFRRIET